MRLLLINVILTIFAITMPYASYGQNEPVLSFELSTSWAADVVAVAVSNRGDLIAIGGNKPVIIDAKTGFIKTRLFNEGKGRVGSLVFSPNDKYLLTGMRYNIALVYDTETGEIIHQIDSDQPFNPCGAFVVRAEFFWENGKYFSIHNCGDYYRVFETETGIENRSLAIQFNSLSISPVIRPTSKSGIVAYETYDRDINQDVVILHDMNLNKEINRFPSELVDVTQMSPYLIVSKKTKELTLINIDTMEEKLTVSDVFYTSNNFGISKSGTLVIGGREGRNRSVFSLDPGRLVYTYPFDSESKDSALSEDEFVEFFPDGQRYLTINGNKLNIWDISDLTSSVHDAKSMQ